MNLSNLFVRTAAVCLLLLVSASPAAAQRGKWWQDDNFRRQLGLTTEQSARLEEIFQSNLPALRQRMHDLDTAEKAFDGVVEKGADAEVMEQVSKVENARAELNKARTMMLLRMRRALTADQWAKFTALSQAERNAERQPGPPPDRQPDRRPR